MILQTQHIVNDKKHHKKRILRQFSPHLPIVILTKNSQNFQALLPKKTPFLIFPSTNPSVPKPMLLGLFCVPKSHEPESTRLTLQQGSGHNALPIRRLLAKDGAS